MMQSRTVEIWVGLFIAAGMAALFMLAMQVSNLTWSTLMMATTSLPNLKTLAASRFDLR